MAAKTPIVDIHTHVYPPSYISLLQSRTQIPYILSHEGNHRLVILPAEDTASTSRGRPIGPEYTDISLKLKFMDTHGIDISVISLANPWLDWLPADTAAETARRVNQEIDGQCAESQGQLFFFATLPLSASAEAVVEEIARLSTLNFCRGVILGTSGLGKGLDDPSLLEIFQALADARLPIFLHPHYGLPSSVWGPQADDYGHVLPLALGFPMETTIAVTRLILSGAFDKVPELKMILAHSGGTLPFLAGRIESCILHDSHLLASGRLTPARRTVWDILKTNIYLDAVVYSEVGLKAAVEASGKDRVMFGTDHPFFPPLEGDRGFEGSERGQWRSVVENVRAVTRAMDSDEEVAGVMGGNAVEVLGLRV
jgi:predicted TIM-barrel fold metal-dependent hydrolase